MFDSWNFKRSGFGHHSRSEANQLTQDVTEAFLCLRLMLTKGGGGGNGKGGEGDGEGRQGGVEDAGGGGGGDGRGDGGGGDCGGREQGDTGAGGVIVKFGRSSIVVFSLPELKSLI